MARIERLADKARTMEMRDHEIPTVRFAGSVPAIAWKYSVLLKPGDGIDPVRRITAREGFTVVRSRFSREHLSVPRARGLHEIVSTLSTQLSVSPPRANGATVDVREMTGAGIAP